MANLYSFFSPRDEMTSLIVFPPRSPAAQSLWETMLTSKHKEGVMEVRRQLVEAASKEKLPLKMSMGKNQTSTDGTNYTFGFQLFTQNAENNIK